MKVIWHHSNGMQGGPCVSTQHHNVNIIDNAHRSRWPGFTSKVFKNEWGIGWHVGYHFVIDVQKGIITQTRDFGEEGAHTIGMNTSSVGVLIIGNYDKCSGDTIPLSAHRLIVEVWEACKARYPQLVLTDNVPHRKYSTKSCFGDRYPDDYIQKVIKDFVSQENAILLDEEAEVFNTLLKKYIDLLRMKIALLTQRLTGKRLSAREVIK